VQIIEKLLEDPFNFLIPLGLFIGVLVGCLILRRLILKAIRSWADRTHSQIGQMVAEALRSPMVFWAVMLAVHAATAASEIPRRYQHYVPIALQALWVWSLISVAARLASRSVRFYGGRAHGAQSVTSLTEKLVQLVIVSIGIAWLMRVVFGLSLTPIITGLGVGGIAVALALQDTLANLFAGFYVSISGLVRLGDYIKLSSGEDGVVADITWRCTTLRNPAGNLVVVPNNKLGQALYTNYALPETAMGSGVTLTVAPDSEIDKVEAVLLDEAKALVASGRVAGLVSDSAPGVSFNPGPTDWGLGFTVGFRVKTWSDQDPVKAEMRKVLIRRLRQEGIRLAFANRTLLEDVKAPAGVPRG
jgi:small-conductance mechanosensitive channel